MPANFSNFTNVAVLHYAGAQNTNPSGDPSVNVPAFQLPLNETDLHVSQSFFLFDPLIDEVNFSLSSHLFPLPWY